MKINKVYIHFFYPKYPLFLSKISAFSYPKYPLFFVKVCHTFFVKVCHTFFVKVCHTFLSSFVNRLVYLLCYNLVAMNKLCTNLCFIIRKDVINIYELPEKLQVTLLVIVILCYFIAEGYKIIFKKKYYKYIPIVVGIVGGLIAVLMKVLYKDVFSTSNIFEIISFGVLSGLASTGTNELIKQILGKVQTK